MCASACNACIVVGRTKWVFSRILMSHISYGIDSSFDIIASPHGDIDTDTDTDTDTGGSIMTMLHTDIDTDTGVSIMSMARSYA